jgi:hypothetical protein
MAVADQPTPLDRCSAGEPKATPASDGKSSADSWTPADVFWTLFGAFMAFGMIVTYMSCLRLIAMVSDLMKYLAK